MVATSASGQGKEVNVVADKPKPKPEPVMPSTRELDKDRLREIKRELQFPPKGK